MLGGLPSLKQIRQIPELDPPPSNPAPRDSWRWIVQIFLAFGSPGLQGAGGPDKVLPNGSHLSGCPTPLLHFPFEVLMGQMFKLRSWRVSIGDSMMESFEMNPWSDKLIWSDHPQYIPTHARLACLIQFRGRTTQFGLLTILPLNIVQIDHHQKQHQQGGGEEKKSQFPISSLFVLFSLPFSQPSPSLPYPPKEKVLEQ